MMNLRYGLPLALSAALLSGCSDSDVAEVKEWMKTTEASTEVSVEPISEPTTFIPFAYGVRDEIDPFDPNKLLAELARQAAATDNPLKPDTTRRKEFLETFPLDGMTMVGTMNKGGTAWGLIRIDRSVYQVKAGQRLGQNFGLVTGVADTAISVKETVQDAGGEWVERITKLELQESKETTK
ncbi:pilus assembly protein PilP [Massilia sp. PAMC28688]|uniref:pilus assembly protein PilP n=1 Tax=Massilia sp. PAMC28688 TaxID=2861283 RepID=UPI001C62A60A|nr:pilus assembly protein PilP [Massilia sp. PAMC28688]QYF94772.1 pilus assembly protein PilP [Massilia sp. PAMC28688]